MMVKIEMKKKSVKKATKKAFPKPDNPNHKEDFNKLLEKAAKPHQKKSSR
jgi:hypothetical protein